VQTPFACGQGFAPTPSASALSLSPLAGAVGPRCRGLECNYTVTVNRKDYGIETVNDGGLGRCLVSASIRLPWPRPPARPLPLATNRRWQRGSVAHRTIAGSCTAGSCDGRRDGAAAGTDAGGRAATCCRWQYGVSKGARPLGLRHGPKAMASRLKCCRPLSPAPPLPNRAGPATVPIAGIPPSGRLHPVRSRKRGLTRALLLVFRTELKLWRRRIGVQRSCTDFAYRVRDPLRGASSRAALSPHRCHPRTTAPP